MRIHVQRQVIILLVLLLVLLVIGLISFDIMSRKAATITTSSTTNSELGRASMQAVIDAFEVTPNSVTSKMQTKLQGVIPEGMTVFVNEQEVVAQADNSFVLPITLQEGLNYILVVAINDQEEQVSREIILEQVSTEPKFEVGTEVKTPVSNKQTTQENGDVSVEPSTNKDDVAETDTIDCGTTFGEIFLCLLNEHRIAFGKKPLQIATDLEAVALAHSEWMQEHKTLSHSENDNSTAGDRCEAAGTMCYAENVAFGFNSTQHLFELWRESPGHNANMLGNYSVLGLGVTESYATALFR